MQNEQRRCSQLQRKSTDAFISSGNECWPAPAAHGPFVKGPAKESDTRTISELGLSVAVLTVVAVLGARPFDTLAVTPFFLALLVLYASICACNHARLLRGSAVIKDAWMIWFGLAVYSVPLLLSGAHNEILFLSAMFAILLIALHHGFTCGFIAATGVAAISLIVAVVNGQQGLRIPPIDYLIVASAFIVLGHAVSYVGGEQKISREKIALLESVTQISNPRFGIDRTLEGIVSRIRQFYGVDSCLLVIKEIDEEGYILYTATKSGVQETVKSESLDPAFAKRLMSIPAHYSVVYQTVKRNGRSAERINILDVNDDCGQEATTHLRSAAYILDALSYMSAPFRVRGITVGRIYLSSRKLRKLNESDLKFLVHVVETCAPLTENIRLLDRLASDVADQERKRIARDLHDTTIQPFIGLSLGLRVIGDKLNHGSNDVSGDIHKLISLTEAEIGELRQYVNRLKNGESEEFALVDSVRRFTAKFSDASGIKVDLGIDENVQLDRSLAAEVFQLITEGLSNVRRHTQSANASVEMKRDGNQLNLVITNQGDTYGRGATRFRPRSISERALSLGGNADIVIDGNGLTHLKVSLPL
jgi:signal transduction histidine kinase